MLPYICTHTHTHTHTRTHTTHTRTHTCHTHAHTHTVYLSRHGSGDPGCRTFHGIARRRASRQRRGGRHSKGCPHPRLEAVCGWRRFGTQGHATPWAHAHSSHAHATRPSVLYLSSARRCATAFAGRQSTWQHSFRLVRLPNKVSPT